MTTDKTGKLLEFAPRRPKEHLLKLLAQPTVETYSVRCPRKGPLGAEMSVLICDQMHRAAPELCAACKCNKANELRSQIDRLRTQPKGGDAEK